MKKEEKKEDATLNCRIPQELKDRVDRFAEAEKRNLTNAIYYLLDSHPLLQEEKPGVLSK